MNYLEYIQKFNGLDHPFGDLAEDINIEIYYDEEVSEIFRGDFSEIYHHLISQGAADSVVNTFVASWVAFQNDKENCGNLGLLAIATELREIKHSLKNIDDALYSSDGYSIAKSLDILQAAVNDCTEGRRDGQGNVYRSLRINGCVDTFEQNT